MASPSDTLKDVEAYVFDVFGTVVDWYGNITSQLAAAAPEGVDEGLFIIPNLKRSQMDTDAPLSPYY